MNRTPLNQHAKKLIGPEALATRIARKLDALGQISDEPGYLTRLYLGKAHARARTLVAEWMQAAGMDVRQDPTATLMGRYEGSAPNAPALLVGSHIDTVRRAGQYDGALGVVAAIEAVHGFHMAGQRFPFAIEVAAFGDEEGVRFPSTLGGSRALAGRFDAAMLDETDENGITRRAALTNFGCDPELIPNVARTPADCLGYLELHIEQGPVLEAEGLPVGIVTAIAGASRGTLEISGRAGHAGTTPMALRKDALTATAEIVLAIEQMARATQGLVATVGRLDVPGGAPNTVAGLVRCSLDVRSAEDSVRINATRQIETMAREIASRRGVTAEARFTYDAPAAACDVRLINRFSQAVSRAGLPVRLLPSGAGHDGMAFRGALPFAMLFVRCRGGISHHPDEYAAPQDMGIAAHILADMIRDFDNA